MKLVVSALAIAVLVLWGVVFPASLGQVFDQALLSVTRNFGWFYLWEVLALVMLALFLAVSRYGDLRLGGDDEEPEFSSGAWFSMLFAAGMGIGLVFWGVAEPLSHYASAPPGTVALTPDAANTGMKYSFFHWGFHPWAVYSIVGLAIAYFRFRRGAAGLVSAVTSSLPWLPVRKLSGVFDVVAIIATAFGVAASLGIGAAQINRGLNAVFGIPNSTLAEITIIVIASGLFMLSAATGVNRGIKWLSSFNLMLAAGLAALVFFLGPTIAIVNTLTTTLGAYISDLVRMSLRMTPFRESAWVGNWTVFYWAWWISWSPFVGLFIARISRGRTVREFIVGTVLAPCVAAFVWFSVFGGTALYMEIWQGVPIAEAVRADVATALFALFDALPLGTVMSVMATLLVLLFFVTSGDSATLVLGMMSSGGSENPSTRTKLVWGLLITGIAISLLLAGGIKAMQTATIVFALPFAFVIPLMAVALIRAIRADWFERQHAERAMRRRLLEMVGAPGNR
ncbi:BCCT family transporter [Propionivibrio dicarboxylicus]|uniref:Glycine betaine transporter n=1 Tax=Propionivibrio dicarboxylicus TaxID=83767 RepID=A0A1G7XXP1_9RHOO|nr:BCCT family transporter [Propionivibrio dicarboxylicus]SDG88500.1 glycine betaine transporter [Propionivibrio dicarboxylicus]